MLAVTGCHSLRFPDVPANYREFAYVTSGGNSTVSVLDLVYMRLDRVLKVGRNPAGITANPKRNEVYAVNTGTPDQRGSLSVIDTEKNVVVTTIPLYQRPSSISVDAAGERGYVANTGSNTVSVLDLIGHREVAVLGTGEQPVLAKISPDGHSLVVSNRGSGSVSIYSVSQTTKPVLRATFGHCAGASDIAMIPNDPAQTSTKAFVTCSDASSVLAVSLAQPADSWAVQQEGSMLQDHLLARLKVGMTPVHLAVKPDGGEIFVSNFGSNSISEISTWTNEVGGTYKIGSQPVYGLVSRDNTTLWVSNLGSDSISLYSIDDGRLVGSVHTGAAPDAIAMSADEHLLLAADTHSGDIAVIRTHDRNDRPELFTLFPAGMQPNGIAVKSFQAK